MSSRNQASIPPWMNRKRPRNADSPCPENLEKHQEILSFVRYISLNSEQKAQRNQIVESVRKVIGQLYPTAEVHVYGSCETDLCLPQSDIDLVVFGTDLGKEEPNLGGLFKVAGCVHESGLSESFPTVISSARVPILKFKDQNTGVLVDISFEVKSALESTELIKKYVKWYPMLRPLTLVLKYYLKQRYLNENWTGGIGSYTLVVMVLSFLQLHTPSRGRQMRPADGEDLSTLMISFLQFYGSQFDYFANVISVLNGGSYLRKADKNWVQETAPEALSVEDPSNVSQDLAAGSYRIKDAREVFMEGFYNLTSSSSQRWAHTHSFLVRLFEAGTNSSSSATPNSPSSTRLQIAESYASQTLHNGLITPLSSTEIEQKQSLQLHQMMLGALSPSVDRPTTQNSASGAIPPAYASSGHPSATTAHVTSDTANSATTSSSTTTLSASGNRSHGAAPRSPTKRNNPGGGSRDNRSRNHPQTHHQHHQHHQQHSSPPQPPAAIPPTSPKKPANGRRNAQQPASPTKSSPRKNVFLDPAAPEYHPLFPPLPAKSALLPTPATHAQNSIATLETAPALEPSADQISGITNAS